MMSACLTPSSWSCRMGVTKLLAGLEVSRVEWPGLQKWVVNLPEKPSIVTGTEARFIQIHDLLHVPCAQGKTIFLSPSFPL